MFTTGVPTIVHDVTMILLALGLLDKGSPEELGGAVFVLAGEEVDSGRDKLVQAELSVVVCVDRFERRTRHLRIQTDYVEEQLKLLFLNHSVAVGVDGTEEERQRAGERFFHRRVLHLFLERRYERVLV